MSSVSRAVTVFGLALALAAGATSGFASSTSAPDPALPRSDADRRGATEVIATGQRFDDGGPFGRIAVRGERMLAAWNVLEGTRYAWRTGATGWSTPRLLADTATGPVAVGPDGTMLMTWQGPQDAVFNGGGHLYARARTSEGWGVAERLGPASNGPVEVAIDESGATTVVWAPNRNGVSVVSRPADGDWGQVTELPGGRFVGSIALATNRQGDAAIAWDTTAGIRTAMRTGAEGWAVGPDLPTDLFHPADIELALDETRRMIVLWGLHPEDGPRRRYLAVATKAEGAPWSRARYLDVRREATVLGTRRLALDVNRRGDAVAAWSTEEVRSYTSRVARLHVDTGTWTKPVDLEKPGVSDAHLRDSGAAFVGLGSSGSGARAFWWVQPPGEPWQRRATDVPLSSRTAVDAGAKRAVALIVGRVVEARHLDLS